MKFSKLAQYFQQLENLDSRLKMTELLAQVIKEASVDEVGKICYLTLGRLGPLFSNPEFNLGDKMIIRVLSQASGKNVLEVTKCYKQRGDVGDVAMELLNTPGNKKGLSVLEVYNSLLELANDGGPGSQDRKVSKFSQLLSCLDPLSAKYVCRIPVGALRMGFSDLTILDALSWFVAGTKEKRKEIEAAYSVFPDLEVVSQALKKKGLSGLRSIKMQAGIPILPAKAQRLNSPVEIFEKIGSPILVEPKLDGARAQIHLSRRRELAGMASPSQADMFVPSQEYWKHVRIFSRNLEDVTAMYPEISRAVWDQIRADEVLLDGELLGLDEKSGKFLPFQEMIKRKRKHGVGAAAKKIPLRLFVFDIMYLDGASLLDLPLFRRREFLEQIVGEGAIVRIVGQKMLSRPAQLVQEFDKAMEDGLEGLMVKNQAGFYEAGARGFNWIKLKGELDTIDAVVLGYYAGRGKRSGFGIGAFLVGIYDPSQEKYVTVAKVGTGLSDDQWREMKKRCDRIKVSDMPSEYLVADGLYPDVWVRPDIVVVIKSDEITKSPLHTAGSKGDEAGLALRFPRLVGFREDKGPTQATTVAELKEMYLDQKPTELRAGVGRARRKTR